MELAGRGSMKEQFSHIRQSILYDDRLNCAEKIFLGMVHGFTFNKKGEPTGKGLFIGNSGIGRIVKLSASSVSRMIARLGPKDEDHENSLGLIRIDNAQSKYRRIYFAASSIVEDDSTLPENEPTLPPSARYFAAGSKHKGIEGKDKGLRPSAGADTCGEKPSADDTDWDLYDQCARSLTRDADPAEVEELLRGMPQ
jgi:hypothetical protein